MAKQVAFLRAINVGGRFIKMAVLSEHFRALGCSEVSTFLTSGNVILESLDLSASELESGLEPLLGYRSEVFLRTPEEVEAVALRAASLAVEGATVYVGLLSSPLEQWQLEALAGMKTEVDDFVGEGREIYWILRIRVSDSKITNAMFERRLKVKSTFRTSGMLARLAARMSA